MSLWDNRVAWQPWRYTSYIYHHNIDYVMVFVYLPIDVHITWKEKNSMENLLGIKVHVGDTPLYDCLCSSEVTWCIGFNTLRPRQNGRHFPDDIFKWIFLNENVRILITISLKFVPKVPINNIPALVQIMAWRRPGDKPLSEPMMDSLLTHICVTRPQWVMKNATKAI